MPLLEAKSVTVRFRGHNDQGRTHLWAAVDGVSLSVDEGERVGIIGESGSGKTTLGKALLGLEPLAAGQVFFKGALLTGLKGSGLATFRRSAQMIFQDPLGSLNPRLMIGSAIEEVLKVHHNVPKAERSGKVAELLRQVGLDPEYRNRYPHEFSGGQRQRIGIARALALNPCLLVADEPVSALDVSVQAQVLNLIRDLSEERHMAVILVAHDLAVVNYVCHRVLILYKGSVVEEGPSRAVFAAPSHPYTQLLKSCVPDPDDDSGRADPAGAVNAVPAMDGASFEGCAFATRCPRASGICRSSVPRLESVGVGRKAACFMTEPSPLP